MSSSSHAAVPPTPSKLSKLLGKSSSRDRSRSGSESAPESASTSGPTSRRFGTGSHRLEPPPIIVERPATADILSSAPMGSTHSVTSKLSGWLSHTFSSSTDLPALLASTSPTAMSMSPRARNLMKHSRSHIDKAVRYLMDTDVQPSTGGEAIWLLGVEYPGPEHPPPHEPNPNANTGGWPEPFYNDFTHITWLTYRSSFPPIKEMPLSSLPSEDSPNPNTNPSPASSLSVSTSPSKRFWEGRERAWTSDSGWGCMLRTGQCLLAQALIFLHLGRQHYNSASPTPPINSQHTYDYISLLTLFLDSPLPQCPFSVHRFALAGKELGKDVGQWFGPSTAAGAIKRLVALYPSARLGVTNATDGTLYESEVFEASYTTVPPPTRVTSPGSQASSLGRRAGQRLKKERTWGDRAVLVLVGVRLGLDGVNPVYYECIKQILRMPCTVGISGGRPSSSYYFVGYQGDHLIYLDPHFNRNAVPFPPLPVVTVEELDKDKEGEKKKGWRGSGSSGAAGGSGSPKSSNRSPFSSRRDKERRGSSPLPPEMPKNTSSGSLASLGQGPASPKSGQTTSPTWSTPPPKPAPTLTEADLKTYSCDKVRKMGIGNMDPSMLLGFLIRGRDEWEKFRKAVGEMPKPVFSIADEPPSWSADDGFGEDDGMQSVSEPDVSEDEEGEVVASPDETLPPGIPGSVSGTGSGMGTPRNREREDMGVDTFDEDLVTPPPPPSKSPSRPVTHLHTNSNSSSNSNSTSHRSSSSGEKVSTDPEHDEEEVEEPLTPGPASRFPIREDDFEEDDDDDEWVDPVAASPPLESQISPSAPVPVQAVSTAPKVPSKMRTNGKGKTRERGKDRDITPQAFPSSASDSSFSNSQPTTPDSPDDWETPSPPPRTPLRSTTYSSNSSQYPRTKPGGEQYPFPLTASTPSSRDRERKQSGLGLLVNSGTGTGLRARDGGRTKSGGVKAKVMES